MEGITKGMKIRRQGTLGNLFQDACYRFSAHSLTFYSHNFTLFLRTHLLFVPISHHFINSFILKLVTWVLYFRICAYELYFSRPHNKRIPGFAILRSLPFFEMPVCCFYLNHYSPGIKLLTSTFYPLELWRYCITVLWNFMLWKILSQLSLIFSL